MRIYSRFIDFARGGRGFIECCDLYHGKRDEGENDKRLIANDRHQEFHPAFALKPGECGWYRLFAISLLGFGGNPGYADPGPRIRRGRAFPSCPCHGRTGRTPRSRLHTRGDDGVSGPAQAFAAAASWLTASSRSSPSSSTRMTAPIRPRGRGFFVAWGRAVLGWGLHRGVGNRGALG